MTVIEDCQVICGRDLPAIALEKAAEVCLVGCDTETSGFDWERDKIGTCQIYVPGHDAFIIQMDSTSRTPRNLKLLMQDSKIRKVFHHAIFDLRFILSQWDLLITNVACTKIASKILEPFEEDHTLKSVLQRYLGIRIEKELGASDWLASQLSEEQVRYAVQDAIHLPQLLAILERRLERDGRLNLAQESFHYLPTRTLLDVLGAGDVFTYAHDQKRLRLNPSS